MFKLGDKVYSMAMGGGAGYNYEFGIVTNITKTGKIRIRLVENVYPDDENNKTWSGGNKYRVIPNFDKFTSDHLVKLDGTRRKPSRSFELYSDTLKLYAEADFGW